MATRVGVEVAQVEVANDGIRFGLANWRVVVVDTAPLEVVEEQGMQTTGIQAAELHSVRGSPV